MCRSLALIVIGAIFTITFPLGARAVDVKKKKADSVPSPPATHVAAGNHFAFDLYGKLRTDKTGENLFFSPTSISLALVDDLRRSSRRYGEADGRRTALGWRRCWICTPEWVIT